MLILMGKYRGNELRLFFPRGSVFLRRVFRRRVSKALKHGDWLYVVFEAAAIRTPAGVVYCSKSWEKTKAWVEQHRIVSVAGLPEEDIDRLEFRNNRPVPAREQALPVRVIQDRHGSTSSKNPTKGDNIRSMKSAGNAAWATADQHIHSLKGGQSRAKGKRKNFARDYEMNMREKYSS